MGLVVSADTDALKDWSFDENGNANAPGGRAVAEWLFNELSSDGIASQAVANHENYGWAFESLEGVDRIWCLVAGGAEQGSMYFWAMKQPKIWQRVIGKRETPHGSTLDKVEHLLAADGRFRRVRIQAPDA